MDEQLQPFDQDQEVIFSGNLGVDPGSGDAISWLPLLGTMFVFFLILIIALYVIRYLNQKNIRNANAPWVRILDRQALGNQQVLYLVELAGQLQVLGVTDHQIQKISDINDPEIVAEILEDIANRPAERTTDLLLGLGKKSIFRRNKKSDSFSQELKRLLEEVEK